MRAFIKTDTDNYINLKYVVNFRILHITEPEPPAKPGFYVRAKCVNNTDYYVARYDTKKEAERFIQILIEGVKCSIEAI